ncbi:MAG: transposase [Candidatus Acidiferrales bacterium]
MTVERAVQLIKGGFSYRAKKELGFNGEIWQKGFSDVRITDDDTFARHVQYIAENPVKAGYALSPVEYRYCSAYLRRAKSEKTKSVDAQSRGLTQRLKPQSPPQPTV